MFENTKKNPLGLYLLCFTELWERFGFYTIQTILILYMTKALGMNDQQANLQYAAFGSLVYLTPVLGGWVADRFLGFQHSIMLGGLMFIAAYLICALPGQTCFFLGLSVLICANGFFKPNVSAIVGELYQENDPRRDGGFTLFYMGINVGALIPPLIAGGLVVRFGWHSGFILAALGMTIGQIVFIFGKNKLGDAGLRPAGIHQNKKLRLSFYFLFVSSVFISIFLCYQIFLHPNVINNLMEISAIVIFIGVLYFIFKEPIQNQKKMIACFILILISLAFWSLYNQTFTSLMLFADRNMDHHLLGLPFDAEATQFCNPFFIILLSPTLSKIWLRLDNYGLNPSTQMKFFLGIIFMTLGFLLLAVGAKYFGVNGVTSSWILTGSYFLQTIGELLISPIGLAMITVLCPKKLIGMMMGVWFFSQAASFTIGAVFADIAVVPQNVSTVTSLSIYAHAFTLFGMISLVMALASLLLVPLLNHITSKSSLKSQIAYAS
jgi:POT family proton-dependent oligopeptide transporter